MISRYFLEAKENVEVFFSCFQTFDDILQEQNNTKDTEVSKATTIKPKHCGYIVTLFGD